MPSSLLVIIQPDGQIDRIEEGVGYPCLFDVLDFQTNAAEDMGKVVDSMDDLIDRTGWGQNENA
jgi:hypothetical protein